MTSRVTTTALMLLYTVIMVLPLALSVYDPVVAQNKDSIARFTVELYVEELSTVSTSFIASQIRSQANSQGVRLTDNEVQSAAQTASNKLRANDRDPLKGIIHIKFKKFTVCITWGADKNHC